MPDGAQATLQEASRVIVRTRSGQRTVYHTDRDCPRLPDPEDFTTKPFSVLAADIRKCRYCADDVDSSKPSMDHFESLKAAAREEAD